MLHLGTTYSLEIWLKIMSDEQYTLLCISGEVCSQSVGSNFDEVKTMDLTCSIRVDGKESSTIIEEVCYEDDNSDDDYDSIQRPAFLVEGEPDFESGPPQDGLEYLRRVRYAI